MTTTGGLLGDLRIVESAAFIAARASSVFSDANWWTVTPFSCAATFSASGRAPGFSGAQNTAATSSPRARNASSTALPKSCWPTIAMRIVFPRVCVYAAFLGGAENAPAAFIALVFASS